MHDESTIGTQSCAFGRGSAPCRAARRACASACRARGSTPASPVSPLRLPRRAVLTTLFHDRIAEGGLPPSLGLPPAPWPPGDGSAKRSGRGRGGGRRFAERFGNRKDRDFAKKDAKSGSPLNPRLACGMMSGQWPVLRKDGGVVDRGGLENR